MDLGWKTCLVINQRVINELLQKRAVVGYRMLNITPNHFVLHIFYTINLRFIHFLSDRTISYRKFCRQSFSHCSHSYCRWKTIFDSIWSDKFYYVGLLHTNVKMEKNKKKKKIRLLIQFIWETAMPSPVSNKIMTKTKKNRYSILSSLGEIYCFSYAKWYMYT